MTLGISDRSSVLAFLVQKLWPENNKLIM